MRKLTTSIALMIALGATPSVFADDSFSGARDDAPFTTHGNGSSVAVTYALAPDAHDDAGVSARTLQLDRSAAPVAAYALAGNARDDAGLNAPDVTRGEVALAVAAGPTERNAAKHECTCML